MGAGGKAAEKPAKSAAGRARLPVERARWAVVSAVVAVALILAAFRFLSPIAALETRLSDTLRIVVAPRQTGQDPRVAIVTITEETLVQFPYRSPIDRLYLAGLVQALADAGARMLVLDILFDQPTEPEKDRALIAALRAFPGPALAAWGDARAGLIDAQQRFLEAFSTEAGLTLGFANVVTDDDGVVRRFATTLGGTDRLSLPAEAAGALPGAQPPRAPGSGGVIDWRPPASANATLFQQIPSMRLTDPPNQAVGAALARALRDRVVFVGADLDQQDRHQTPLAVDPANRRTIPGVAIQAAIFTQLLDGRAPPLAGPALAAAVVAAMGAVGAVIGLLRWALMWKAAATTAVLLAYAVVVYGLAGERALFLPVAPALAAATAASLFSLSIDSYLSRRDEKFIRRAFSHYLEPAMVEQLARDPDSLRLGGERRELSLLFTDIEGFTTTAEKLPPEQLTLLMNAYFDAMCAVVLAHGGTIDKFIGDAIVAMFGAPRPLPDHALRALLCAAEMDRTAEAFRARNGALGIGATRIGVHSGVATVGNFGGSTRFDYTAIGDTVNIAARLENVNKRFGTRVAVSEETLAAARAAAGPEAALPAMQTIGRVGLKGKTQAVSIFAIATHDDRALLDAYEAAFALIDTDPAAALSAFEAMHRARPDDSLPAYHLQRLSAGVASTVVASA